MTHEEFRNMLNKSRKATELHDADRHEEALELYESLYDHYCEEYGQSDEHSVLMLYHCADELFILGRYTEALPLLQTVDSWNISNPELSIYDIRVGSLISQVYVKQCEGKKAVEYSMDLFERALKAQGAGSSEYLEAYEALINSTEYMGDIDAALSYCQSQHDIAKEYLDTYWTAWSGVTIGRLLRKLDRTEEAMDHLRAAYKMFCQSLGEDSYNALVALHEIGITYGELGKRDEQINCYRKGYETDLRLYGTDCRNTHIAGECLAIPLCEQGEYKEAMQLLQQSSEWNLKNNGEDSDDYNRSLINLTMAYAGLGDYLKAFECCERAYKFMYNKNGADHPGTVFNYRELAVCYADLGDYDTAIEIVEQVRDKYKYVLHDEKKYENACDQIEYYKKLKTEKRDDHE